MNETAEIQNQPQYAGFWLRFAGALIDSLILIAICMPLTFWIYGGQMLTDMSIVMGPADVLVNWVFPAIAIMAFWLIRSATPGKLLIGLEIQSVDGSKPSLVQFVIRYVGYFVSALVLALGYLWVGWDKRKQGWHDKFAGTIVVKK